MKFITYKQYVEYLKNNKVLQLREKEKLYEEKENEDEIYDKKIVQEIDKRHDKMFRKILSIKREMISFLNEFLELKEKFKEEEIAQCKTDFITKTYQNRQSDVIYKIKDKPVYFLVEHQSTIDKDMVLRTWEYVGEIIRIESIMQKTYFSEESVYPIVIPIVIYTGYQKWNAKRNLGDKQYDLENFEKYKINFEYNLIAIQDYTFEELLDKKNLFGSIMIIEKCKTEEEIKQQMEKIIEIIGKPEDRKILAEIISNVIVTILGKEKTNELLEKLERKEESRMSPFTKCLLDLSIKNRQEGKQEGKQEGRLQGRKENSISIAKKMLERKMKITEIEEITGLSKEEIEKYVIGQN